MQGLKAVLAYAADRGYSFVPPTPLTHSRVISRRARNDGFGESLRDILGWNLPFLPAAADPPLLAALAQADALQIHEGALRSRIRVAALDGQLYAHSGFPTDGDDAVFFGPDTYRFVRYVRAHLPSPAHRVLRCLDAGCGSGAGGISIAIDRSDTQWTLSDVNPDALRFAQANLEHAGIQATLAESDGLRRINGQFDCIIINPPYLIDAAQRCYRDGGGEHGEALSVRLVRESLPHLTHEGRVLLYTGVPIIAGRNVLLDALTPQLQESGYAWELEEIDPDVFGEELEQPAYEDAERIAAIGLKISRRY